MKFNYLVLISIFFSFLCQSIYCSEDNHKGSHDNEKHIEKDATDESHGSDHTEDEEDSHEDAHKHEDENEDDDEHSNAKAIGEGKAIIEVNKERGFKLSMKATKALDLKLANITAPMFVIPKKALVVSRDIKGIYRLRDEYFKFIPIKNVEPISYGYRVTVKEVKKGDQVVIDGVSLLRVTDTYSTDKSEYGHAH